MVSAMRGLVLAAAVLAVGAAAPPPSIRLGAGDTLGVAFGFGSVWAAVTTDPVASYDGGDVRVFRLDERTGRVMSAYPVARAGTCCGQIAAAAGRIWVSRSGSVVALDPASGRVVDTIRTGERCIGRFAVAADAVWRVEGGGAGAALDRPGAACRVDLSARKLTRVRLPATTLDIVVTRGRIWVGLGNGSVVVLDRRGRRLRTIVLGDYPVLALAAGRTGMWATNAARLARIDGPAVSGAPRFFSGSLAAGHGSVWALAGSRLVRFDERRARPSAPVEVRPGYSGALAVAPSSVWVASDHGRLQRIPLASFDGRAPGPIRPRRRSGPRVRWCSAADLRGGVFLQGATGSFAGGVDVLNRSPHACALAGPPRITVVDRSGRLEPVAWHGGGATWRRDHRSRPRGWPLVVLQPGRRADAFVWWSNWCGPIKTVLFRFELRGGGRLSLPTRAGPRCDVPGPSALSVSPFELRPKSAGAPVR